MNIKKLLFLLAAANVGHVVKLRHKKVKSGNYVLLLDYYKKPTRERLHLGITITLKEQNKHLDEKNLAYAIFIRDKKEGIITAGGSLKDTDIGTIRLSQYSVKILENKNTVNARLYQTAINSFIRKFSDMNIQDINAGHAQKFLLAIKDLSSNTKHHYIQAMSHILNNAISDGLVNVNPFESISVKVKPAAKEYLTLEQVQSVMESTCPNITVKQAFLFACFTGLRIGDIMKLTSDMIQEGYLVFRQNKTGSYERMKLLDLALDQIDITKEGPLFDLPTYKYIRSNLQKLITGAGITKHITFHCARHTFATMCLTLGTDLYTVSKLLGHSDVRVTQVYAKLVDQVKDSAIDNLNNRLR